MELSNQEHREIEEVEKETGIIIDDPFYGDYYGHPVYKLWTESDEASETFHKALIKKGFNPQKVFREHKMIVFNLC